MQPTRPLFPAGQVATCRLPASSGRWLRVKGLVFFGLLLASLSAISASQALSPQAQTLVRHGQAALDAGDFARAASDFEQARQLAPENLEVSRGLLLSYLQTGRLAEAVEIGRAAVARWPGDASIACRYPLNSTEG